MGYNAALQVIDLQPGSTIERRNTSSAWHSRSQDFPGRASGPATVWASAWPARPRRLRVWGLRQKIEKLRGIMQIEMHEFYRNS